MRIDVLTLFPDVFNNLNSFSIIKKAIDSKKVELKTHNLRDFSDNSRKVDDYPYGGSPGMVIKIEPIDKCIEELKKKHKYDQVVNSCYFSETIPPKWVDWLDETYPIY